MEKYILSLDCGTQSTRVLLFDLKGNLIDKEQISYQPYVSPQPSWAEQDPQIYWDSFCKASRILKKRNPQAYENLLGIGLSTQRNSMINLDAQGQVLRPCILWLDQRKAKNGYKGSFFENCLFSLLKIKDLLNTAANKSSSNWIRENQPEIWAKTHKYVQVSGYFNYKLTGEYKDSVASQIGYIPFDSKKLKWSKGNSILDLTGKLFPIEKEKLPTLVEPGEIIGYILPEISEETGIPAQLPVIACGSDKGCETLGVGVTNNKTASLSFGTTATVQTSTSKYIEPVPYFPAYPSLLTGQWNPEIEIYRGYWMISWFKEEFADKEVMKASELGIAPEILLNELLKQVPAGSMGLTLLPYWSPGVKDRYTKGAMVGFGDVHKKNHVYRAVIEGLAYGLLDGLNTLEKRGNFKFKKLAVSGGASQSDEICQITCDIMNLPLYRVNTHETSGLGAAIMTAYGVRAYPDIQTAVSEMVHYSKTFEPNKENAKLYHKLYKKVFTKLVKTLDPIYENIQKITHYPE